MHNHNHLPIVALGLGGLAVLLMLIAQFGLGATVILLLAAAIILPAASLQARSQAALINIEKRMSRS